MKHNMLKKQNDGADTEVYQLLQRGDSSLMMKKLYRLFPVMLLNRISIMIMLAIDSIVVGWRIGGKAVASVNYLQPFHLVIGAVTLLISSGVATLMSKQLGTNDPGGMERKKKAVLYATLLVALVLSIIQIPICRILFNLYDMDAATLHMARRYAYAFMLCTPFSIMNTICTYLLTSIGHASTILTASLLQSGVNVVLDVLFVFGFGMSTDGAGLGTLGAGVAYWVFMVRHLFRHSEYLKIDFKVKCRHEILDIVRYGMPLMITSLAEATFGALFIWFISKSLSDTGVGIHSVCLFAASFATAITLSLRAAMQSLTGMLSTIGDVEGMHQLLKRAMRLCLIICCGITLTAELFPVLFFHAYGFHSVPAQGTAALRAYSLHFILMGVNTLLLLYFNSWDDVKFASVCSSLGSFILPAFFSTVLFLFGVPWTIWLCYVAADIICFALAWHRYLHTYRSKNSFSAPNEFNVITHPDEAPRAAEQLQHMLLDNGIAPSLANRVSLCVEEIGAYAVPVRNSTCVTIQLYACVYPEGETTIIMLDDGQCITFPKETRKSALAATNYELLREISTEVTYDYVLDLNRFIVKLCN